MTSEELPEPGAGPAAGEPGTRAAAVERRRAARKKKRNRDLIIGAAVGTVITVVVLVVTLAAGGSEDPAPTDGAGPAAFRSTTTLPLVLTQRIELPPGDYRAFCKEVIRGIDTKQTATWTPQRAIESINTFDFDALLKVTPEALKPKIERLRDAKPQLLALMEQVDKIEDISIDDVPKGVPDAVMSIVRIEQEKCAPAGLAG